MMGCVDVPVRASGGVRFDVGLQGLVYGQSRNQNGAARESGPGAGSSGHCLDARPFWK